MIYVREHETGVDTEMCRGARAGDWCNLDVNSRAEKLTSLLATVIPFS
jgi:hypothetical protein